MSTMDPAGDGGGGEETGTEKNTTAGTPSTHHQHPPPSPLSGCYLLVVLPEPHTAQHKDLILSRLAKGFLSWDKDSCHVDLEKELQALIAQAPEGEEARNGERLIQYATENLVTEVLIHPQTNTLLQCIRNLLASFTKHRHIIHAGYTFGGNGSWILQDGTFSYADFVDAFSEHEVQRVLRAYENSVTVDIHCAGVGEWSTARLSKEPCTRSCQVKVNPDDVLTAGVPAITSFTHYIDQYLVPQTLDQLMEPSDVVGNIRFSHPTLYVFPGGQGDAALFGINGFNMLVDGGFARKACFWDFARHLDRLDAVLVTRINNSNIGGMSSVLRKKKEMHVYPQIGHFFCNLVERRHSNSPDGDKDIDPLILDLIDMGQEMMVNLRHISLRAHHCYRDPDPINLYHKVGHGTLDMYVLSPSKDSKEVREFLAKWHASDSKLFSGSHKKDSNNLLFPIQNVVSICALLVWQPANPESTITRILFPGSTPQHKIFEGLDRLKHLEFLKHPTCSSKSLSPSTSLVALKDKPLKKMGFIEREAKRLEAKKRETPEIKAVKGSDESPQKSISQRSVKMEGKTRKVVENKKIESESKEKKIEDKKIESETKKIEEMKKKESAKIEKPEKQEGEMKKTDVIKAETEKTAVTKEHKAKPEPKKKEVRDLKPALKTSKPEALKPSVKLAEKKVMKPAADKKDVKSSPTTPKKTLNGTATKTELSKAVPKVSTRPIAKAPSAAPAKSAKDANNRKVVEQKNIEMSSLAATSAAKAPKAKPAERKPISRRTKPVSPSKARIPISPAKSTRSTPTTSVKSDKDGVIRKVKGDKGTTDSSTVSTPSGIEPESVVRLAEKSLTEKSEDMSLDSIESKVLADLKEEREVVEEIEAVLQKAERIEEARKEERFEGDDEITAEATDKKEEDMTEEDVTAEIEDAPKKEISRKASQELTEEDEYLIVEKEEIYTEDSAQSGEGEQKYFLDEVESEKAKILIEKKMRQEEETDEKKDEVPEKKLDLPETSAVKAEERRASELLSPEQKEQIKEEIKEIIATAAEAIQKTEEKDDSGKKDSEDITKEPSSLSPDKMDSSEKKTNDTDPKPEVDQKELVPEKMEESQEKISTLESGATTTAPTLPEDERITLDDIKEDIDEKHVAEEVKEKVVAPVVQEVVPVEMPAPVARQSIPALQRDAVKTPDEVADLPVHEEVDPKLYAMDDFSKDKDEKAQSPSDSKQPSTPSAKEQKGVFSFFGKVADKFEKGIDKLTKKKKDSDKDTDDKSSSKSSSPKDPKPQEAGFENVDMDKVFQKVGKLPDKAESFEQVEPTLQDVKMATIKETATFLQEEIQDLRKSSVTELEAKLVCTTVDVEEAERIDQQLTLDEKPPAYETLQDEILPEQEKDEDLPGQKLKDEQEKKDEAVPVQEKKEEVSPLPEKKDEILPEQEIKDESLPEKVLKEESAPLLLLKDEALPEQVKEDAALEVQEKKESPKDDKGIEEVKEQIEESSKKSVKDSLRDSLESLEEKGPKEQIINLADLPPPGDIIADTLTGVAEKLEEIKPSIDATATIKELEEEQDIPEDKEMEAESEEDDDSHIPNLREAVRDVGEVLAGTAGIHLEEKPKDVVEIVKKVAEVLKDDDFLSEKVLSQIPEKKEETESVLESSSLDTKPVMTDTKESVSDTKESVSDTKESVSDTKESVSVTKESVADTKESVSDTKPLDSDTKSLTDEEKKLQIDMMLKKVGVTEQLPSQEEVEELIDIAKPLLPHEIANRIVVQEEPCVKVVKDFKITSPAKEEAEDRENILGIGSNLLESVDICETPGICSDEGKTDVMEAGLEQICTKTILPLKLEETDTKEEIESSEIGFEQKLSPGKAELVIVTPGSTPSSPKFPIEKISDQEVQQVLKLDDQLSADIKQIILMTGNIEDIIEEIILSKKQRITTEIIEYIVVVKHISREKIIEIIENIVIRRGIRRKSAMDIEDIIKTEVVISPQKRNDVEDYIEKEYVNRGKKITAIIIEEISLLKIIPKDVIMEIIESIVIKRQINKESVLDLAEEEPQEDKEEEEKDVQGIADDQKRKSIAEIVEKKGEESVLDIDDDLVEGFVSIPSKDTVAAFINEDKVGTELAAEAKGTPSRKSVSERDDFEAVEQEEYKVSGSIQSPDISRKLSESRGEDEEDSSDVIEADEKFVRETKEKEEKIELDDIKEVKEEIDIPIRDTEVSEASEVVDEKYLDEAKEKVVPEKGVSDISKVSPIHQIPEEIETQDSEKVPKKAAGVGSEVTDRKKSISEKVEALKKEVDPKDQESQDAAVHKMLVTASSEDGGHETEICAPGTITFTKTTTPDDSLKEVSPKSTPEKDSLVMDKDSLLSEETSPEKDSISDKSPPQAKEKISPVDSLDKSPVGTRDSQDLDDSLEKKDEEAEKTLGAVPVKSEGKEEKSEEKEEKSDAKEDKTVDLVDLKSSKLPHLEDASPADSVLSKSPSEQPEVSRKISISGKLEKIDDVVSTVENKEAVDKVSEELQKLVPKSDDISKEAAEGIDKSGVVGDKEEIVEPKSRSASVSESKPDGKEEVKSRSGSIVSVKDEEKPKSRSTSVSEKGDHKESRSGSIVDDHIKGFKPLDEKLELKLDEDEKAADRSKSPSIAGEKPEEKDVSEEPAIKSRASSVASEKPEDRSKSPSIAGDKPSEPEADKIKSSASSEKSDEKEPSGSKSPSVAGDKTQEKDLLEGKVSRSSSIASEKPEIKEAFEKAKSPALSEKSDEKEAVDRSKSPSIAGDKSDEKESLDRSKSPSIAGDKLDEKEAIDRSKSPSIAGDKDLIEEASKSRASSVASEKPDLKEVADREKSPGLGDKPGDKEPVVKSRSASIVGEKPQADVKHDKESTDDSISPSIVGEKPNEMDFAEEPVVKSRTSSISGEKPDHKEVVDFSKMSIAEDIPESSEVPSKSEDKPEEARSRSASVASVKPDTKEDAKSPSVVSDKDSLDGKVSRSSSIASEKPEVKESFEKAKSPALSEKSDEKETVDRSKSPSIAGDKPDEKDSLDRSKSPSISGDKLDEAIIRSKSPSIAGDKLDDKEAIDRSKSPSIAGDKPDEKYEKDSIESAAKSRSSSIASEKPDTIKDKPAAGDVIDKSGEKESADVSKSSSIAGDKTSIKDLEEEVPKSRSSSISSVKLDDKMKSLTLDKSHDKNLEEEALPKSTASSVASEKPDLKSVDRSKSPSIVGDKPSEKDLLEDEVLKSSAPGVSLKQDQKESIKLALGDDEKEGDRSKSPSIAGDKEPEKDLVEFNKSRSSSIVSDKFTPEPLRKFSLLGDSKYDEKFEKEQFECIRSGSLMSDRLDEDSIDRTKSPSSTSDKSDDKDTLDRSKSPSIEDDKLDFDGDRPKSRSPSVIAEKVEPLEKDELEIDKKDESKIGGKDVSKSDGKDASKIDEKDRSRTSSIGSVKIEMKETVKADSEKEGIRSRSSSIVSDKPDGKKSRSSSIASEKGEMKLIDIPKSPVADTKAPESPTQTPKDRSRSHSLFEGAEKTPVTRSRTGSLFEDKPGDKVHLMEQVKGALEDSMKSSILEEMDETKSSMEKLPGSRKQSEVELSKESVDYQKDSSESKSQIVPDLKDVLQLKPEERVEIESYVLNECVGKKRKISAQMLDEMSVTRSLPKSVIVVIIEEIILKLNIPRDTIVGFEQEEQLSDSDEDELGKLQADVLKNIEKYIIHEYIEKSKKLSLKAADEIARVNLVSRRVIIAIIEEIILVEKLTRQNILESDILELEEGSKFLIKEVDTIVESQTIGEKSSESKDGVTAVPDSKHSSLASVKDQDLVTHDIKDVDGKSSITEQDVQGLKSVSKSPSPEPEVSASRVTYQQSSDLLETQIPEEISISEEKRTEIKNLLFEDYITRGKRITEIFLQEIINRTHVPRYIILEIIDEIIFNKKLSRDSVIDKLLFLEDEPEDSLERSLLSTPDRKSSGYSTPEIKHYDDKLAKAIPSYVADYESPFHKAFVGGMTEIRTTHITTLSGKSTPDLAGRADTPESSSEVTSTTNSQEMTEKKDDVSIKDKIAKDLETEGDMKTTFFKTTHLTGHFEKTDDLDDLPKIVKREVVVYEEEPEIVETVTTRTTRTIVIDEGDGAKVHDGASDVASDIVREVISREEITIPEITTDVKKIVKTVTTVTDSSGQVTSKVSEFADGSSQGDKSQITTSEAEKIMKETIPTSGVSTPDLKAFSDSGKSTPDPKLEEKLEVLDKISVERMEHSVSPLVRDLVSDDRSYSGKSSPDISLPKDIAYSGSTGKSTPDIPMSPLIRDGAHVSDKRLEGRSRTSTPEGFRSGEVIRTIITTTRTMSDDGEIITTTKEVTEATNEKGETVVITQKTDVKVDDCLPESVIGELKSADLQRGSSPGSDAMSERDVGPTSPRSDLSSGHSRAATHVWGSSEERHTYSDDEPPSSPLSTTSHVGQSPRHFEQSMTSSFYGELPTTVTKTETSVRFSDPQTETKKLIVGMELAGGTQKSESRKFIDEADLDSDQILLEEKDKKAGTSATSSGDKGAEDKSKDDSKKDPIAGWGSPLGLPSPKPPRKFTLRSPVQPSSSSCDLSPDSLNFDVSDWGEPLRLPSPAPVPNEVSNKGSPGTPKKERKQTKKVISENIKNKKRSESPNKNDKKLKDSKNKVQPVYMDLTYVPHHGNSYYTALEFFKRVRARYYVFSGTEPSREVYDALLEAKKTWEDKDLEVTMIPTYDTDTLGYWVADNEEALAAHHIDLSPSASRCTINLQDHETSCSAYRLEF